MFYLYIHMDGHLVCFYFDIMSNAAMKIHTYAFVWTYIFISRVYLRSRIAVSYGKYMFNIMKHYQTLFQNDCTILQTLQQCMRVPVFPHPCQYLVLPASLPFWWYETVSY